MPQNKKTKRQAVALLPATRNGTRYDIRLSFWSMATMLSPHTTLRQGDNLEKLLGLDVGVVLIALEDIGLGDDAFEQPGDCAIDDGQQGPAMEVRQGFIQR